MTTENLEESKALPIRVYPNGNGCVALAIGETAVAGTWIDVLELTWILTNAAWEAAREIDVPAEVFYQNMTDAAVKITMLRQQEDDQ